MKKLIFALGICTLLIGACSNDQQPTPKEIQKVEDQVAKDQAAQDSMEQVIKAQIEASQTGQ
jgi:hypothetical protein